MNYKRLMKFDLHKLTENELSNLLGKVCVFYWQHHKHDEKDDITFKHEQSPIDIKLQPKEFENIHH